MSHDRLDHLLTLSGDKIQKQTTHVREPISPVESLSLVLQFLTSGDSQQSLCFSYRVGKSTASNMIQYTWDGMQYTQLISSTKTP